MFAKLKSQLHAQTLVAGDSGYDEARKIYNGMIDKHPGIIVRCTTAQEVSQAVRLAREEKLEVSIRSGGHNGAGLALVDGGMVIDLSGMKGIAIDAGKQQAKVEPGNTLSEVDQATHEHGLALPSGIIGSTGIGGITLGGGLGYLSRKGGLTIDNLLECEVVLANGDRVTANTTEHPDLFWALRGGGGNFGVVTSFTFNLLPIKNVYAGPMFWPMEKAAEAMRFYDKVTKDAPDDLYGFFAFLIVPSGDPFPEHLHGKNVCGVVWCYTGDLTGAEDVFAPIRAFGPPILDFVSEIPMPALNTMFDQLYPPGLQWYWRAHYVREFSEGFIAQNIAFGKAIPTMHSTTHLYPIDGKVHAVSNGDTAWANRDARWAQVIVGVDPDPGKAAEVTNWCKSYYEALQPFAMNKGAYVNFMMEEGAERVQSSYGDNYHRLVKIKSKYDPDNFFHINQNIKPE